jgi:hypothetical protein
MSSFAITTIVQMIESLPDVLQEQVADHIRTYIAERKDSGPTGSRGVEGVE